MGVKTIYVVRHGFRSNWVVNPSTGEYTHSFPTPTGIPSDPALAAHGVDQSHELATHLAAQTPPIEAIYSSPFYRCLQTISPTVTKLNATRETKLLVRPDAGLGEFYGLARFDHPRPATLAVLDTHFPGMLDPSSTHSIESSQQGESVPQLHDRVAYAVHRIIAAADAAGYEAVLLCTHAAVMIALGRVLTGRMPADEGEDDFQCATCSFSKFVRRGEAKSEVGTWDETKPEEIPATGWRTGGVQGGWTCEVNGECGFLSGGAERGWSFAMSEAVLDPQAKEKQKH